MSVAAINANGIPAKSQATILCIHDDKGALGMRTALLQSAGYSVLAASTADQAMALFVENEIDLVLSDQLVRGVSGTELSLFMKQVRPGVAVVLLAGSSAPSKKVAQHLDAFVRKNCTDGEVLRCIKNVLSKKTNGSKALRLEA